MLFEIEEGRIRPSKMLAEKVGSMLKGNEEFATIDYQRLVFRKVLRAS